MKKTLIYILGLLLFLSCEAEEEKVFLLVEKTNMTFLSAPGVEMLPVSTNGKFTATSSQEWCTVTPSGNQLKVTVTENVASDQRTAIVSLSAEGAADVQVNVKQAGAESFFTIDSNLKAQQFDFQGESRTLKVDANIPFTAKSSQAWCNVEILSDAARNLRISVTDNEIIRTRVAEVVISAKGFEDLIISVNQDGSIVNKQGMVLKGWVSCNKAGIPDVVVSDGYEVTVTDENGVYYLPSEKQNKYVFISVPGNYEVSNKVRSPQFFKRLNEGVNVVERHDFELTAVDNNKHVVMTLADIHLAKRVQDIAQYEEFIVDLNASIADYKSKGTKVYALTLGDLSWDTYWYSNKFTIEDYVPYMNKINAPVFNTMGNHDNNPQAAGDWAAQQMFRDVLCPSYYSFNLGNIHYVVLDDIEYINNGGVPGKNGERNYNNVITTEQIEWLKKDLEKVKDKSAPLIIALHIPVFTAPDVNNNATKRLKGDREAFYNSLSEFSNVHVIAGHSHTNSNYVHSNSLMEHVTAAVCATWWWTGSNGMSGNHISNDGSVGGYGVWEMDDKSVKWHYKSMGYDRNYQFRTYDLNNCEITAAKYAPRANATYSAQVPKFADVYATASTANEVLINVWGYDKDWTITAKEGESILPVTRVMGKDPLHIISYSMASLNLNKNATLTSNTSHLFKVKASSPVSTLNIKVTDRFGRTYTETMTRPKDLTRNMK